MTNPYAPPAAAPLALPDTALPPEMRRFRLEPNAYRTVVRRLLFRQYGIIVLTTLAMLAIFGAGGLPVAFPALIATLGWGLMFGITWLRLGAAIEKHVAMYEVIVSPRVVRRVMLVLSTSEMLRPEVTRIVETSRGLWLVSRSPRRTMTLSNAIDGYADLRNQVAAWGSVESLRGWQAAAFSFGQLRHMRPRDRIEGALANDPSLVEELTMVRAVSADRGGGYGPGLNVRRRLLRLAILWLLMVVAFLAVWQILSPGERKPTPRRPPPAPTAPI